MALGDNMVSDKSPVFLNMALLHNLVDNGVLQPQKKFKTILKQLDAHITKLEHENNQLKNIKTLDKF